MKFIKEIIDKYKISFMFMIIIYDIISTLCSKFYTLFITCYYLCFFFCNRIRFVIVIILISYFFFQTNQIRKSMTANVFFSMNCSAEFVFKINLPKT